MPDPQTWDRKAMLLGLGGDETLLAEVVRIFLEEAPRALTSLRDASERGDASMMERISHTLRGDLAYMALPELGERAGELEEVSRNGNLDQARSLAKALEQKIEGGLHDGQAIGQSTCGEEPCGNCRAQLMSVIVSAPGPVPVAEPRSELCDRILVAEDDPIMRTILQTWLLDWGYNVVMAEDGAKAWKLLQQVKPPDLIIVDWMMPEMDGPELCRRIRSSKRERYQYVLLATSKNDRKDVVAGFDAGADDYLTKPFDKDELRARLRVARRILTLQHNLIRAQEELRFQADHDVLTGIWNRGALLQLLNREIERSARTQAATAVMMVDLDHFKKVNDTYGHLAGDAVLKETTLRMTRAVRLYDLVGRYGGEEFVLVLPDCDVDQVLTTAERIRLAIDGEPVRALGAEISVTASIGATVASSATISATELLATADTALYQAKNSGRNRTIVL